MRAIFAWLFFLLVSSSVTLRSEDRLLETQEVAIGELTLTVPLGVEVERIAAEPLIRWPVVADWDDQGRLVVVESGGVSRPIDQHNLLRVHRVVRLIDTDHDGIYDERLLAADQLPFAQGILAHGNSLLVAAPPEILRLIDADGDGYCEQREVWFDGKTITGCANDLHGPYEGPEGWIYWCKGAFAQQQHATVSGQVLNTNAAHVFRRRLEGGPLESVLAGGMDNPVEVAFLPSGELFFTSTFLTHPRDGLRDGVTHGIYGGVYGKQHDVLAGHRRTGPLMPITIHLGAAAPSGLAALRSESLSKLLQPSSSPATDHAWLAAALFNHHKVTLHRMIPEGATYRSENYDLLRSERIDFHPTDVLEAADGSLIVIDTGGWYDLCCPSSHVDQKAAPGGIYRLRNTRREAAKSNPPSSSPLDALSSLDLVARRAAVRSILGDPSSWIVPLGDRVLDAELPVAHRIDALWLLGRIDSEESRRRIVRFSESEYLPVDLLTATLHLLSIQRNRDALPTLLKLLNSPECDWRIRRASAEAVGRIGIPEAADSLFNALDLAAGDPVLEHSILYALIELGNTAAAANRLHSESLRQQRGALIVLEQLDPRQIDMEALFDTALSTDQSLRDTAIDLIRRGTVSLDLTEVASRLESIWEHAEKDSRGIDLLVSILESAGDSALLQQQVGSWIDEVAHVGQDSSGGQPSTDRSTAIAELLAAYRGETVPPQWSKPLGMLVEAMPPEPLIRLLDWLRPLTMKLASDGEIPTALRSRLVRSVDQERVLLAIIATLPQQTAVHDPEVGQRVVSALLQKEDPHLSQCAARALERLQLLPQHIELLLERCHEIPPLALLTALDAAVTSADPQTARRILDRLDSVPAAKTLTPEQIRGIFRHQDEVLRQAADQRIAVLFAAPQELRAKVQEVLATLGPGDPLRGYQIFRSREAACSQCHRIGYLGSSIGPELTHIGSTRSREDLLEAILFPSARLEQSYQPSQFLTHDGRVLNGLVMAQSPQGVEIVVASGEKVFLARETIEQRTESETSIMPAGLAELLTPAQLADLLALLQSSK